MIGDDVQRKFAVEHGRSATVAVRAPGRVNLIGEHTDYSELPVLPIAIAQGLTLAAAPRDDGVVSVISHRFEPRAEFHRGRRDEELSAPWHRYVVAALAQLAEIKPSKGADVLVFGDLPADGGLSSSSSLTTGLLAVLARAWGAHLEGEALVAAAAVAERHTGVETGGMDQAAIVLAEAGCALRIDFRPPATRAVALPGGLSFVVAYSGEVAPKGGAARDAYNERVVGARIAATMIADEVGVDLDLPPTLGQVADIDVVDILVDGLPEKVTPQEVAHGSQVDLARIVQLMAATFDHMTRVPVKRVARHILAEAGRVAEAEKALGVGDLMRFGALLNESHNSLREDLRCSTPNLDRLCAAMRRAGALGARLTGAGFGGYALGACDPERVQDVIAAAKSATGGPAFEVAAGSGLRDL